MKKQSKVIAGVIILVVLLMGIGYAALANITLTINGTAAATASQDNFKVYFTGDKTTNAADPIAVDVTVANEDIEATVAVSGLTKVDDEGYAILKIANASNGIDATSVNVTTVPVDTTNFDFEAVMCDESGNPISNYDVAAGDFTYVKVSAKLKLTPTTDVDPEAFTVKLTAEPAEN